MAEEPQGTYSSGLQASDLLSNISPEAAEHTRKLVMAVQNASEEDTKAVLDLLLSKSNKADSAEKEPLKSQVVPCNDLNDGFEQVQCTPVGPEAYRTGYKVEENGVKVMKDDLNAGGMGQLLDTKTAETKSNSEALNNMAEGKEVLGQVSFEAEKMTDQMHVVGEMDNGLAHTALSEDEKLPELLSIKANDMDSEARPSDEKEFSETARTEFHSRINHLSETTESQRSYPLHNTARYESSSDDDQTAKSSSDSDVSSVASEASGKEGLSNEVFTSFSQETDKDEGKSVTSVSKSTYNKFLATNESNEDLEEPVPRKTPVLQRTSSLLSTGTQTSSEENLQGDQVLKGQESLNHDSLSSLLTMKGKESSKLPFYYQPQIVMHGQQPVLVLQPIALSASLSKEDGGICHEDQGVEKSTVPIILPLGSLNIDKATRDAILERTNGTGSPAVSDLKDVLLKGELKLCDIPPSLNTSQSSDFDEQHENRRSVDVDVAATRTAVSTTGNKTTSLPELVPPSELDKAFSAVPLSSIAVSCSVHTATSLSFPSISLPSTNPFAKDLHTLDSGHGESKVDDLTNLGLDKTLQQSLFGPPSLGARPKQLSGYQEPASVKTANPFAPDLAPKKRGRRQDQFLSDQSTEVVVTAEVHSPVGSQPQSRPPRRRLSSDSMVTLIETTYADVPASSAELTTSVVQVPSETTQVREDPKPMERNTNNATQSFNKKSIRKVVSFNLLW